MKMWYTLTLVLIILPAFSVRHHKSTLSSKPIAIAELFTSEGCSSCPAAEEVLKEMADLTSRENVAVVGLAFHITYWDHLGWKDPYSQVEFTNRQKKYSQILSTQQYTPQVVINGEYEFIGGNPIAFRNALTKAAGNPLTYDMGAKAAVQGNEIVINYSLNRKSKSELLNVALVETSVENHVTRGENKDRVLKHYNVVRKFVTVNVLDNGEVKLEVPENLNLNNSAIILYVQHRRNLRVLSAVKIDLKSE